MFSLCWIYVMYSSIVNKSLTCNRYNLARYVITKREITHNAYIGVYRTAPRCKHFSEGYSTGHPFKNQKLSNNVRYGCWFSYYPESTVYIRLIKPLFVQSRGHIAYLTNTTNELPADYHWCDGATRLGYSSIVIHASNECSNTEIVICHGLCMTSAIESSCPGIQLYDRKHNECNCNKNSMEMTCDVTQQKNCRQTSLSSYNKLGYSIF